MKLGSDGIYVAAPIWRSYMDHMLERFPETGFADYTHRPAEALAGDDPVVLVEPVVDGRAGASRMLLDPGRETRIARANEFQYGTSQPMAVVREIVATDGVERLEPSVMTQA